MHNFSRQRHRIFEAVNRFKFYSQRLFSDKPSFVTNPFKAYGDLLCEHPVVTKAVTSAAICGSADLVCQSAIEKGEQIDYGRVGRFTLIGATLTGPLLHYWYAFLARRIPGTSIGNVIQRLFLDQVVFSPFFLQLFMGTVLLLEGRPEQLLDKLKRDLFPTLMMNYVVWVPVMFLNFKYVPPQFNVLFSNFFGFLWNIYLSFASHKVVKAVDGVEGEAATTADSQPLFLQAGPVAKDNVAVVKDDTVEGATESDARLTDDNGQTNNSGNSGVIFDHSDSLETDASPPVSHETGDVSIAVASRKVDQSEDMMKEPTNEVDGIIVDNQVASGESAANANESVASRGLEEVVNASEEVKLEEAATIVVDKEELGDHRSTVLSSTSPKDDP